MSPSQFFARSLFSCVTIFALLFSPAAVMAQNKGQGRPHLKSKRLKPAVKQTPLRDWELRLAPIMLLASSLSLDVSYRLNKDFATGPAFIHYGGSDKPGSMFAPNYKGYALGWAVNYYGQGITRRTWYLAGHGFYDHYQSRGHATSAPTDYNGPRFNASAGYQWHWSRFLMAIGGGMEYSSYSAIEYPAPYNNDKTPRETTETRTLPFLEFKLGFEI